MRRRHSVLVNTPRAASIARPGDLVTFVTGPGESPKPEFASHAGIAYGVQRSRFGDSLRVKMPDFTFHYVEFFSKIGIGAYHHPKAERRAA
jgi:hypothetical protein